MCVVLAPLVKKNELSNTTNGNNAPQIHKMLPSCGSAVKVWLLNEGLSCSSSHRSAHPPPLSVRALTRVGPHFSAPTDAVNKNNTREQPLSNRVGVENKRRRYQGEPWTSAESAAPPRNARWLMNCICRAQLHGASRDEFFIFIYVDTSHSCLNSGRDIKARIRDPQFQGGSQFQSPLEATGCSHRHWQSNLWTVSFHFNGFWETSRRHR